MADEVKGIQKKGNVQIDTDLSGLQYPVRGFRFTVEFQGVGTSSWREVNGFGMTTDTPTYREGGFGILTVRKLPGLVNYDDITLSKGVYNSAELYTFFSSYLEGSKFDPVTVTITVYDNQGNETASWIAYNAWPSHYESSGLNAESSDILVESLTLVHEGMERVSAS